MEIVIIVAVLAFAVFLLFERKRQLIYAQRKRVPNMENLQEQFDELTSMVYADRPKSDSEFWLGFALVALLDALNNPEEYTDDALNPVFDLAEEQAAIFSQRYDEEIRNVNNGENL